MKHRFSRLRLFIEDNIILRFFPRLLCARVDALPDEDISHDVSWAFQTIEQIIDNPKDSVTEKNSKDTKIHRKL